MKLLARPIRRLILRYFNFDEYVMCGGFCIGVYIMILTIRLKLAGIKQDCVWRTAIALQVQQQQQHKY